MKPWILVLASALAVSGCTTLSLERHTLAQGVSAGELRYQEVVDNLALIANDPSTLPVYSSIYYGTIAVTDQGQIGAQTTWQHVKGVGSQNGFASQTVNPQLSRTVLQNWSLDPILVPEKLEAIRSAAQWAVYGPERVSPEGMSLLASPDEDPAPGRHFGVRDRLARLEPGWVHYGRLTDVPLHAAYKGHCRGTWVWIMPEGLDALAEFALVVQNIARVSSNSLTLFHIPPSASAFSFATIPWVRCEDGHPYGVTATVSIRPGFLLSPDVPYYPWRVDNVGSDAALRSQVNAAGITP
jgi:hypothetical protein